MDDWKASEIQRELAVLRAYSQIAAAALAVLVCHQRPVVNMKGAAIAAETLQRFNRKKDRNVPMQVVVEVNL